MGALLDKAIAIQANRKAQAQEISTTKQIIALLTERENIYKTALGDLTHVERAKIAKIERELNKLGVY